MTLTMLTSLRASLGMGVLAVSLCLLEGCATNVQTFAPPGKGQAQLDAEANSCNRRTAYAADHVAAYAQCMHRFGNDVQRADGTIWPGAPTYAGPSVPEQPQEDTSVAGPNNAPTVPSPSGETLTPEQQELWQIAKQEGEDAFAKCTGKFIVDKLLKEDTHLRVCIGDMWVKGMLERVSIYQLKNSICSGPDILQRIPYITPERESYIVSKIGC
jgi:hypothetical protein